MTWSIALVLVILAASLALFVSERLQVDLVALLVLTTLTVTGLTSPAEALAGFSNPAVITVWAMFMISAALARTGVARLIGDRLHLLAGQGPVRAVVVVMLTAGGLSAFMNNIGVAALLMPVVVDLARRSGHSPSLLLMPLSYGCLLGGLTTLVGTPPNLLVAEALREAGLEPFGVFDFTPVGLTAMAGGALVVTFLAVRTLPGRAPGDREQAGEARSLMDLYALQERTLVLRLPAGSVLAGRTLAGSRLGSAAGLNVLAVLRRDRTLAAPSPETALAGGDRLLVGGRPDRLEDLRGWRRLLVEETGITPASLTGGGVVLAEVTIPAGHPLVGETLRQSDFRRRHGLVVMALRRDGEVRHLELADLPLRPGDRLLVQGARPEWESLREGGGLAGRDLDSADLERDYAMRDRIFAVTLPPGSSLAGRTLAESRLGDAFRLGVMAVVRDGRTEPAPSPDRPLAEGDRLLLRGDPDDLEVLRGLQELVVEGERDLRSAVLEQGGVRLAEVLLSPRTTLAGRTLRDLRFRERYGLQVLAVQRGGQPRRSGLRDLPLAFGDALLVLGPADKLRLLAGDGDFLVLDREIQAPARTGRAPVAIAIVATALAAVLAGWLPIAIAAVAASALLVLTGCLAMDEAYRAVDWKAIFLIAGMLPLGAAMQDTGAAAWLAEGLLEAVRPLGVWGVLVGIYVLTAAATMIIPTAALVVLMAPIALKAAADTGLSPHALMMALAMAASASFTSPISHPANLLVMGPGGYRFKDYLRLGLPLTAVVLVLVLLVLPIFWPLEA